MKHDDDTPELSPSIQISWNKLEFPIQWKTVLLCVIKVAAGNKTITEIVPGYIYENIFYMLNSKTVINDTITHWAYLPEGESKE